MNSKRAASAIPTRLYYVEIRTVFDRPELRGAGYLSNPSAHSTLSDRISKRSLQAAVSEFNRVLGGEWDFGSEYCCEVEVFSTGLYGEHPRCERKKVYRVRDAGAEKPVTVATESEQFARRMAAKSAQVAA